jgi:radical SAM protein with 4Fe4S-binding SPASM domain
LSLPFCLFEPKFVFDLFKEKHAMSGCIARKKSGIVFGVNGEAGFCNHLLDFPFGKLEIDFKTGKQLEDLYYSQTEFFKQTNRVPDIRCMFCSISSLCCGGCPVKWTSYKPKDFIKGGDSFLAMEQQFRSLVSL